MGKSMDAGTSHGLIRRACTVAVCRVVAMSLCAALMPVPAFADQIATGYQAVDPRARKCQPWMAWLCNILGAGVDPVAGA
jgi:hypothetical protein